MPGPNFLVIGAMKCGTSTVCAYLEDHPQVFMLPRAEPNFFCDDANWNRGVESYEALFDAATPEHVWIGEGSNNYANGARFPQTVDRIKSYNPDLRLIYIVRDPVVRMRSDWIQRRTNDPANIPDDLARAIDERPEILVDQSMYWDNLQRYRAAFPDDQIHLAFLEDLHRDKVAFFRALTDFLDIAPHDPSRPHLNPSSGKAVPTAGYDRLTRMAGYKQLKGLMPKGLRQSIKTRFFTTPAKAIELPRVKRVEDQLRADAAQLLEFAGKPANFWTYGSRAG